MAKQITHKLRVCAPVLLLLLMPAPDDDAAVGAAAAAANCPLCCNQSRARKKLVAFKWFCLFQTHTQHTGKVLRAITVKSLR